MDPSPNKVLGRRRAYGTGGNKPAQSVVHGHNVTVYSEEMADRICTLLVQGMYLHEVCKQDGLPSRNVIFQWLHKHEGFREKFLTARKIQMEAWADDLMSEACDTSADYVEKTDRKGRTFSALDHDAVSRSRLRIETKKWLMSKYFPAMFGDHIKVSGDGVVRAQLVFQDGPFDVNKADS